MRPLRTQQLFTDESPPHMFLATLRRAHSGTARSQGVPTLCDAGKLTQQNVPWAGKTPPLEGKKHELGSQAVLGSASTAPRSHVILDSYSPQPLHSFPRHRWKERSCCGD